MKILLSCYSIARAIVGFSMLALFTVLMSGLAIFFGIQKKYEQTDRVIFVWTEFILWIFQVDVVVSGLEHLEAINQGGVMVFNHLSHFDIPVLHASIRRRLRFGAKAELFRLPFISQAMRAMGYLKIERSHREKTLDVYRQAISRLHENWIFVLAPEGTRQSRNEIGRFKTGPFSFAIQAQAPILPVVIRGAFRVLPKWAWVPGFGEWRSKIELEVLPPIPTVGLTEGDIRRLADQTRALMRAKFH